MGGDLLSIEALRLPGKGRMKTTGKLGDVMKELIDAASSFVRSKAPDLGLKPPMFENRGHPRARARRGDPEGRAVGGHRDGHLDRLGAHRHPGQASDMAMTGEVTLRGNVLPIGGLKEKLLAALRGGVRTVLIPLENVKDLRDIPDNVKSGLELIPVSNVTRRAQGGADPRARADRVGRGRRGRRRGGVQGEPRRASRARPLSLRFGRRPVLREGRRPDESRCAVAPAGR